MGIDPKCFAILIGQYARRTRSGVRKYCNRSGTITRLSTILLAWPG